MPEDISKYTIAQTESYLRMLRAIQENPSVSQRELSRQLGISLGKTNYCVQALLELGWIKAKNFKNSNNKIAYKYLLTPKGVGQKLALTRVFLSKKQREFEMLSREIRQLAEDVVGEK